MLFSFILKCHLREKVTFSIVYPWRLFQDFGFAVNTLLYFSVGFYFQLTYQAYVKFNEPFTGFILSFSKCASNHCNLWRGDGYQKHPVLHYQAHVQADSQVRPVGHPPGLSLTDEFPEQEFTMAELSASALSALSHLAL